MIGSDDICIAVVGPTGAGKTSTINSIIAQLVRPNFEQSRAIVIGQRIQINHFIGDLKELTIRYNIVPFTHCQDKNMPTNLMKSQTEEVNAYTLRFNNLGITLINAPSITDTRGRKQENANTDEWVRGLNKVGSFKIIALVLKTSENRIDASTQRIVLILKTLLPEKYNDNIGVFYPHVVSQTSVKGSGVLNALGFPIKYEFYFENSCIFSIVDYEW